MHCINSLINSIGQKHVRQLLVRQDILGKWPGLEGTQDNVGSQPDFQVKNIHQTHEIRYGGELACHQQPVAAYNQAKYLSNFQLNR